MATASMARKQCADCGQRSLETEATCWACGGARFMIPGVAVAGERTIAFGSADEVTMSWDVRRPAPAWSYLAIAGAMAVLMSLAGFWAGRASAPAEKAEAEPPEPTLSQPVPLPQPQRSYRPMPMGSDPGRSLYAPVSPAPAYPEPAIVTVRSRPTRPAPVRSPAPAAGVPAQPMAVYRVPPPAPATPPQPVIVPPKATPRINPQVRSEPAPPAPARRSEPERPAPAPAPTRQTSVVALRNDSSAAVEIDVDGNDTRTARIPSGGTVSLRLSSGSYRLRAKSDGASAANSTLAIQANRTYSLLVGRQKEGGKEILVLIEPLEPDFD